MVRSPYAVRDDEVPGEGLMKRKIKLMPDYQCHPLWWCAPEPPGNIDPATLPLSARTVSELERWARAFDERLDFDDPATQRALPPEAVRAFEQEGLRLWRRLREELSPGYEVSYRSETWGRLFTDPEQLPDLEE
jgi:hypothetical protein